MMVADLIDLSEEDAMGWNRLTLFLVVVAMVAVIGGPTVVQAQETSCLHVLQAGNSTGDGVYTIDPDGAGGNAPVDVYCDMTSDGGGWTLVAASLDQTLDDAASVYYADLATLDPAAAHTGVWDGLRPLMTGGDEDTRFSCRVSSVLGPFDVDLVFYDNDWYMEITTNGDVDSCFEENQGTGQTLPPVARRDLISGAFLPLGDQWNSGFMEGEDSCGDTGDFTVDFDDRGMDGNQSDGTDWGEDDSSYKCGVDGLDGGAWFIWARESDVVPVELMKIAVE